MAKPRIFVSSTFYDLKYIRESLEVFIRSLGYSSALFENGDIPFHHDRSLEESCYQEVDQCHMLVLIIGGRYGSPSKSAAGAKVDAFEKVKSVTQREYEKARERDIPIFIFVEKNVLAEYNTYVRNKDNKDITYAHVDNVGIYRMLDDIIVQRRNNFIKGFDSIETIINWLRDQWAGLFAEYLIRKDEQARLAGLTAQIASLQDVSDAIKNYSESLVRATQKDQSESIIEDQQRILEEKNADRFASEEMNRYLRDKYRVHISAQNLLSAFRNALKLSDYLTAIGLSADDIEKFMSMAGPVAEKDFRRFELQYLGKNEPRSEPSKTVVRRKKTTRKRKAA